MIVNAKIKSTMLGIKDNGIMTFFLNLEWSSGGCGFGGYGLDSRSADEISWIGSGHCYQSIRHILETVGVYNWENLSGKLIRIKIGDYRVTKIGHIIDDKWFDIDQYMKEAAKE